jgi:hypothetical protein
LSGNREKNSGQWRPDFLPFLENEKGRSDNHAETDDVVPSHPFFKIENGKDTKNNERDNFLNRLELSGRIFTIADAVGRYLKTIFDERNHPADQNHFPQGGISELQVPVPRKRHKNI